MEKLRDLSTPSNRATIGQVMQFFKHFSRHLLLISLIISLLIISEVFTQEKTSAHSGGGPPFVLINGKYAATSPLFQGAASDNGLVIPQDLAPSTYPVNKPVSLRVDTTQLGIDPNVAQTMQFSWKFTKGDNFSDPVDGQLSGTSVQKSFSKIGSYLISLSSVTANQEPLLLDTIQVDIVPNGAYSLPKSSVTIQTTSQAKSSSTFENTSASGSTYLWDFGDNSTVKGKTVSKSFTQEYFYSPLFARVVDKNGFVNDLGIVIVGDKGKLSFSLINSNADPKLLKVEKKQSTFLPLIVVLVLVVLVIAALLLFRLRKNIIKH